MLFFGTLYSSKNPKNINIDNNKNRYIRIISEGSRDTLDWSSDAYNSAFHQRNKYYIQAENNIS